MRAGIGDCTTLVRLPSPPRVRGEGDAAPTTAVAIPQLNRWSFVSERARSLATNFLTAMYDEDVGRLRLLLNDDASLEGPLGTADNADDCVAKLKTIAHLLSDIDIIKVVDDGPDVLTWFTMHTKAASPTPAAVWIHIAGKISRLQITCDPTQILAGKTAAIRTDQ